MTITLRSALLLAVALLAPLGAQAEEPSDRFFKQGHTRVSITGGWGQSGDQGYAVVGLGAGIFVFDGLEAGLDGEAWLGSQPRLYKVSPALKYVYSGLPGFKPYAGAFYRRDIYEGVTPDLDAAGGRAGVLLPLSNNLFASAGLVYEKTFNCTDVDHRNCSRVYPEGAVSIHF